MIRRLRWKLFTAQELDALHHGLFSGVENDPPRMEDCGWVYEGDVRDTCQELVNELAEYHEPFTFTS